MWHAGFLLDSTALKYDQEIWDQFFETIKDLLTNTSYVIASSQSEIEYGVGKR